MSLFQLQVSTLFPTRPEAHKLTQLAEARLKRDETLPTCPHPILVLHQHIQAWINWKPAKGMMKLRQHVRIRYLSCTSIYKPGSLGRQLSPRAAQAQLRIRDFVSEPSRTSSTLKTLNKKRGEKRPGVARPRERSPPLASPSARTTCLADKTNHPVERAESQ